MGSVVRKISQFINKHTPRVFPCLVCGVDSSALIYFAVFVIGGVVLSSFCLLMWSLVKGRRKNELFMASAPLRAENIRNEDNLNG